MNIAHVSILHQKYIYFLKCANISFKGGKSHLAVKDIYVCTVEIT